MSKNAVSLQVEEMDKSILDPDLDPDQSQNWFIIPQNLDQISQ